MELCYEKKLWAMFKQHSGDTAEKKIHNEESHCHTKTSEKKYYVNKFVECQGNATKNMEASKRIDREVSQLGH